MATSTASATRILLRTAAIDTQVQAMAERLEESSGHPVALVVDARSGAEDAAQIIALSSAACESLGLYCPADYPWKCGDYGYYLARRRFTQTQRFWLIETDVGFYGGEAREFFRFFDAHREVDLLAAQLRRADHSWFWTHTARARNAVPYRCLFPVTRLSARAIDTVFAQRIAHSRRATRRALWPNDEALVATTLMNSRLQCRDFNSFGMTFYTEDSFLFGAPFQGERLQIASEGVRLVHPVLFGTAYAEKLARPSQPEASLSWLQRRRRWAAIKLNAVSNW